jgi:uncharacterized protein YdhG (YjbR/CyaY superfamily)
MGANGYLILASVVGGLLAAGTGWLLDWQRQRAALRRHKVLFVTGILDDLQHSLTLYDKIEDEWEKTKVVWFSTLNELRESRQTYLSHKDTVVLIENADTRKRLFRYYLKTNELVNQLEYQQQRIYEIQRRFRELHNNVSLGQPELDQNQVGSLVLQIMKDENAEFLNTQAAIPATVEKLKSFKSDCLELINELKMHQ